MTRSFAIGVATLVVASFSANHDATRANGQKMTTLHHGGGYGPCVPDGPTNASRSEVGPRTTSRFARVVGARAPCVENVAAGIWPCRNVDLESFVPVSELTTGVVSDDADDDDAGAGESLNDLWGWTDPDTGVDYAIIGARGGTSFVNLADPVNPWVVGFLPARTSPSFWRDVKVYRDHALVVSEAENHGLQMFDLRSLRSYSSFSLLAETAHYDDRGLGRAHNVFANEETGRAYVVGARGDDCSRGGLHVVDVRDPTDPVFAGCYFLDGYSHDVQCVVYDGPDARYVGGEICFASNENRVTIVDATNTTDVRRVSTLRYDGRGYTHQGWLTKDRRYFVINDEADELLGNANATRTVVADVSDLERPTILGSYYSGVPAIDHNLYVTTTPGDGGGDLVHQANYRAGYRLLDASDLSCEGLSEKAYFDVWPDDDDAAFNGAWSVYPFFFESSNRVVIVSGIESGLFVLRVDTDFPDDDPGTGTNGRWVGAGSADCPDQDDDDDDDDRNDDEDPDCGVGERAVETWLRKTLVRETRRQQE